MIDFKNEYSKPEFIGFLKDFLPDFQVSEENIDVNKTFRYLKSLNKIGQSKTIDVKVFEIDHESENDPRVSLSKESFILMKELSVSKALIVFKNSKSKNYRFSLITFESRWDEGTKIKTEFSNPRRYSFFLGPNAKVKTPNQFLIKNGLVKDIDDLKSRFSIEVVNKQFYKEISQAFTKLVNGLLKLPDIADKSQANLEFAVRLIGRIIFCWFLKEKKNEKNNSLVPKELLSLEAISKYEDYYHNILEPIFFEILNKPVKERIDKFRVEPYSSIPYLNGGLFSPDKNSDYYRLGIYQSDFYNNLVVPDEWLKEFFTILETYNFTIDENTSYDEELSIDPEMLGRIFENLLAEINPETGESARKSTGSYYTPRIIVDYMVDESLLLYLKQQTEIKEDKLKAVISYELTDDDDNPLNLEEREKIVNALEKVKILDPACGSGAFPIGALQKIVFILQQIDTDGSLWFKKQLAKASPEFRKDIEKKFSNKEFDFLRKLGVIRECIYGVDIQPIATEISRLRCFLTLIVDEHINDEEENRGIKPLPNLDFKFVTANSLIGLPKLDTSETQQQSLLPDNKEDIDELKNIRDSYFTSYGIEREQLKTAFAEQQNILIKQFFRDYNVAGSVKNDFMQKITDWKPFTHQATDWFDTEWMFGIKEGFDIVIANPPYGADIDKSVEYFRKQYLEVIKNYADIFKIFFSFGKRSLNKNGILTYITPNVFLTQPRYKDLRIYLIKFGLIKIVNLGQEVFDGAVVPTCITFMQNRESFDHYILLDASIDSKYKGDLSNLKTFNVLLKQVNEMPDLSLYQTSENKTDEIILDKVMEIKDAGIQYHRSGIGLKNKGGNDLFDRLVSSDPNHFVKSVPIWYGKLINNYFISSITDEYFNLEYKKTLKKNESVSYSREAFDMSDKIIWRQTASHIKATIDNEKRWFRNTIQCGWVKSEYKNSIRLEYILALLNSKYLKYLYQKIVNESSGRAFPQVKITHIKKLPIKLCGLDKQEEFVNFVNKLFLITKSENYINNPEKQSEVNEYEKQIDKMVYKLYELTEDEIKIVEYSIK